MKELVKIFGLFLFLIFEASAAPNVVIIISDDAGYADWGFMDDYLQSVNPGQAPSPVPTPNLDALRGRGVLCTNAYTAPVCSPSRAAIVTGSYQNRIGYEFNINNIDSPTAQDGLVPEAVTIFDRMKAEGYTTGAIGKWHLGSRDNSAGLGNRPEHKGVDEFFGIWKGSRNYTVGGVGGVGILRQTFREPYSDTILENSAPWNTTYNYVTSAFAKGAIDFIDRHYEDSNPFFLYVAFTAPHSPIGPSPDIGDRRIDGLSGTRKNYASMVLTMDKEIGNILAKLDDPAGDGSVSLTDETLVIFINDNGGASGIGTANTPLKDWKGSTSEGGTRVPLLMAGPGLPANARFDHPVHSIDLLPTSLAAAGATPPAGIDGVNLLPHLDGTLTTPPHEVLTIRMEGKVGVRMGDWKMVKESGNSDFKLYNLASDLTESTDLASRQAAKLEELIDDLTAFEVGNDKPRHAGLGDAASSINLNDRFVLNPQLSGGSDFTSDLVLVGGSLLNGDFNAGGGSGVQTYAQTPEWQNIGTNSDQEQNATNTSLALNGSRNAIIAESGARQFGLDTGHILAAGEIFQVGYLWRDASGWADGSDRIRVTLFTTSDDTLTGTRSNLQSIDSGLSIANSSAQAETALFSSIPAAAAGKRLFLSIDSAQAGSGFARIDDVTLDRGTLGAPSSSEVTLGWSDSMAWTDPSDDSHDTLLVTDSFAGCGLDFPITAGFSYNANCDMARLSGLPFLANSIRFTGDFTGASPQSATLEGEDLLLAKDLAGSPPRLDLLANGPDFSFNLDLNLALYHDLVISGGGDATFHLNGIISNYDEPRSLTKKDDSTLVINTAPTITGTSTIERGSLEIANGVTWATSPIVLGPDGVLGGNGTVASPVTGLGIVSPGSSIGTLTSTADIQFGSLRIEVDGSSSDLLVTTGVLDITGANLSLPDLGGGFTEEAYVIASYGTLIGTFGSFTNLPEAYLVDYNYDNGSSSNNVALVAGALTPYQVWVNASGLTGPEAAFDADPNRDGVQNGIAFMLGAPSAMVDATDLLPTIVYDSASGDATFTHRSANDATGELEVSSDLASWSTATETPGIEGALTPDGFGPGIDRVDYVIPGALAEGDKLFVRLAAMP